VADVQEWRVREVVPLLGEQLDHCGAPSLSVATGRTLIVKARPREDDVVNVWVDGQRSALPQVVGSTLDDQGIGPGGVDIVSPSLRRPPGRTTRRC
jgi:hypothetical protein